MTPVEFILLRGAEKAAYRGTDVGLVLTDNARLDAVHRHAMLDSAPEGAFKRITDIAARLLNVPIALVGIVEEHRVRFKSWQGLDADQFPHVEALCMSCVQPTSNAITA